MAKTKAADWRPHFAAYPAADEQLAGLLAAAVADFSNTQLLQVAADRLEELGDARSAEVIRAFGACATPDGPRLPFDAIHTGVKFRNEYQRVFWESTDLTPFHDINLSGMNAGWFSTAWCYVPENSGSTAHFVTIWRWRQTLEVVASGRGRFGNSRFLPVVPHELPQPVVVGFLLWRAWWCWNCCSDRPVRSAEQAAEAQYDKLLEAAYEDADYVVNDAQEVTLAEARVTMPEELPVLLRERERAVENLSGVLAMARVCRPPAFRLYVPNLVNRVEELTELETEFPIRAMGCLRKELKLFRRDALAERVNRYKPPPKEDS